ncbi:MAG: hypothetical protein WAT70_08290, partial [Rhizobiaceae bacterium]
MSYGRRRPLPHHEPRRRRASKGEEGPAIFQGDCLFIAPPAFHPPPSALCHVRRRIGRPDLGIDWDSIIERNRLGLAAIVAALFAMA